MVYYYALVILALLGTINAANNSCGKQWEEVTKCEGEVKLGPEATKLLESSKQVLKKCSPTYPQECFAQFDAFFDCVTETAKNADNDSELAALKVKGLAALDQCFQTNPPDVVKGVELFFAPDGQYHESSGGKNATGKKPADKCEKTKEQLDCMNAALQKDAAYINSLNSLMKKKNNCKQNLDWSCTPHTPEQKQCVDEATKPCIEVFMKRLFTCIQGKGKEPPVGWYNTTATY